MVDYREEVLSTLAVLLTYAWSQFFNIVQEWTERFLDSGILYTIKEGLLIKKSFCNFNRVLIQF